ncbi:MAG: prepilin-type N-terminal cleavage/methylation domain-containing protein, partial [Planctomycetes bacterium]|nr:prepilin-type N-terminal cleavage/methylation domain-containing protein [Planctomycetota bacterium]
MSGSSTTPRRIGSPTSPPCDRTCSPSGSRSRSPTQQPTRLHPRITACSPSSTGRFRRGMSRGRIRTSATRSASCASSTKRGPAMATRCARRTRQAAPQPRGRGGFSLTELLVASALGLMVMAALASLFGVFGTGVRSSQALVDLNARLRAAAWHLRQDMHGATSPVTPWVRPEASGGYFQVIEGPTNPSGTLIGDVDDVLTMTVMSLGEPFAGRIPNCGFESPVAEVVWFCSPSGRTFAGQTLHKLHRRQLLVSATPGAGLYERRIQAT